MNWCRSHLKIKEMIDYDQSSWLILDTKKTSKVWEKNVESGRRNVSHSFHLVGNDRYARDTPFSLMNYFSPLTFINTSISLIHFPISMSLIVLFVLPEEDSGVTDKKQITDLCSSIRISKLVICFSPVTPKFSSRGT